jgi:hypothetical protein
MVVAGMAPYAITAGRAEADSGQQQGDDQKFLFHTSDFKWGNSIYLLLGGSGGTDVY